MRIRFSLVVVLIFILFPMAPFAEDKVPKPRVSVIPFVYSTEYPEYQIICETVVDTIELTLKLMGRYDVVPPEAINPYEDEGAVADFAVDKKLDNIIYGEAYPGVEGGIVFEASVYDGQSGQISLTERSMAESIFDIFDSADALVISLMTSFSGMHIGFGSIDFKNHGLPGDYTVCIDGELTGENIKTLDKVLNGVRVIDVKQKRAFGEEVIFSTDLTVIEDEQYSVTFSIPTISPKEQRALDDIITVLGNETGMYDERRETIDAAYERAFDLLKKLPESDRFFALEDFFSQSAAVWQLRKGYWKIEENTDAPAARLIEPTAEVYNRADSFTDPVKIKKLAENNTHILADIIMLKAAYAFSYSEFDDALGFFDELETLATYIPSDDLFGYREEIEYLTGHLNQYNRVSAIKDPLAFPLTLAGAGLGLTGAGVGLFFNNPAPALIEEADALYTTYETSTDPSELASLHTQIESLYKKANAYEYLKWGGVIVGPVLSALSGRILYNRIGDEDRYIRDVIHYRLSERMETARLFYDDFIESDTQLLIFDNSAGSPMNSGKTPYGPSPVFIPDVSTDLIEVDAHTPYGKLTFEAALHPGLNIYHLDIQGAPGPAAVLTHVEQNGRNKITVRLQPVEDADTYRLQAAEVPGDTDIRTDADFYDYPFTELSSKAPEFTLVMPKDDGTRYAFRAAAVREDREGFAGFAAPWSMPEIPVIAGFAGSSGEEDNEVKVDRWMFPVGAGVLLPLDNQISNFSFEKLTVNTGFYYRISGSYWIGLNSFLEYGLLGVNFHVPFPMPSIQIKGEENKIFGGATFFWIPTFQFIDIGINIGMNNISIGGVIAIVGTINDFSLWEIFLTVSYFL